MPTVQQLPPAVSVNPTDEVMLDQDGVSVSATVAQILATGVSGITLTGDVTGSGTSTIVTTLAPVGTPGTFTKVTVNAKGQVSGGGAVAAADVVAALGFSPYNATNPSGYVAASGLATVATSGNYTDLNGLPTLGGMAAQNPATVAITGGSVAGADISTAEITAAGTSLPRSPGARAAEHIDVLDYGADPTGVADSAPAFTAAMTAVAAGAWGRLWVPRGTYRLNSFINQPSGHSVTVDFDTGAVLTGSGGLGVDLVKSTQGPYSLWQGGGGYFGFSPVVGTPANFAFKTDIVQNTANNSASSRIGWSRNYTNTNYYGKYFTGIDFAEQNIYSWPHLYDNSSGWGHWEVITGTTYDEDSAARAHLSASGEHSEFDIVNNGPEEGWTWKSGLGNGIQGMAMDPWGQNGVYGGSILFSYGSAGSYDGQSGGVNQRWPSYPAVFSQGNPSAVATNSTIVITFDATAKASANLSGGGVGSVAVSNGGGIYTSPPTVVFTGGGGTAAAGNANMLGGAVVSVTITTPGSGYVSAPTVSFTGGGVTTPVATTVTLNPDGVHGDVFSIAAAINAAMVSAGITLVRASAAQWGGIITRLVVFGTAASDLGILTLGGTALGTLGMTGGAHTTPRDVNSVVLGGTGGTSVGDKLILNGGTITVGGAGAQSDVVNAINAANLVGIKADSNAGGRLVVTCYNPQNPGGLVVSQPTGYTTLGKIGLAAGTFWPPTPPKGFATAYSELTSPICPITDQLSIAATDLAGNTYGPVTVTLNGGGGSGWVTDVAASIQTALTTAGWYNNGNFNLLSAAPAVVGVAAKGSGGNQGLVVRNTAGGTLTVANVTGTPLQILGIVPGTFQPGGYSAGSQSVFMASEDSIAPQGRGIFLGGASTATDVTTWPHAPLEARGSFLHGLRTDKATFQDNTAVLLGASQAIGFGSGTGAVALTAVSGALEVNGVPVALAGGVPAGAGALLGGTATAGVAGVVAVGGNLTLAGGTLSAAGVTSFNGRSGVVSLGSADVVGALGYSPGSGTGTVANVVAGAGLAGGTITTTGTVSLAGIAAGSLMGNAAGTTGVAGAVAVGAGVTLSAGGTLSNAGVLTFNTRGGAVSLAGSDVTAALGYTPLSNAGGTLSGAVTLNAGGTLAGTLTNGGTIAGGTLSAPTLAGTVTNGGTLSGGTLSGSTLAGTITNAGTLSGGTLAGSITNGGTIAGGTLSAPTLAGTITNSGTLTGGTLSGNTLAGTISNTGTLAGGTLSGTITNAGTLTGGTFAGTVANAGTLLAGTLSGTTLAGTVTLSGTLSGGTLAGSMTNAGTLSGGSFAGSITNAGTITGGTLGGTVTAAGTLNISGTAIANLQAAGDNSTKLATTAYVYAATSGVGSVTTTGGSTTLSAAQYAVPVILVTGALTSAATLVLPNTGIWMVSNRTTGAFTLTVKTAAGTGVAIDQGYSQEVVADGTNVVVTVSDFNAITLQGTVTNAGTLSGGTFTGTITNTGTITGGTLSPAVLIAGTAGSAVTVSQTADVGGYHPVVFRNGGTNTNVPLVLAPAGAGYISTAVSDGTAANGNQRGQYAVDLSQSRTANTQVASGAYAMVPGGAGNTAGGSYSLAAGQGSTATGQGSVVLGQYGNDGGAYGKLVFSANANTVGNQFGMSTLFVSSVSAATRMTSDGNAAGAANSVPIRSNHVIAGTLTVAARNVSNGDGAQWSVPVLFKNSAGTVTVTNPGTAAISPTAADSTLTTATIAIAADNTNKGLSITITPPTSVTVNASAVLLAAEM